MSHPTVGIPPVAFGDALRVWLKVAALSFGGPAGQIAVMHRILVEEKRWVSERRFLHALNYCMLLPGPEAQQLATYIGWLLHRTAGGLVAGGLFIAPGFVAILALSVLYAAYHGSVLIAALFFGLKAAVLAVVVEAVMRIGRRALTGPHMVALAAAAFVAIFFFAVPFPLIIVCAALVGLAGQRLRPDLFAAVSAHGVCAVPAQTAALIADDMAVHTAPSLARSLRVVTVCLLLWATPVLALAWWLGESHVLVREAIFFSKAAVVTFGGAYSVLAYIAQQAVETYGWLRPGEMLDGLGMAETTPGPLIMVVQFVGFMGAYRNPAPFAPSGRRARLAGHGVGHIRAVLPVDLPRRALHRAASREPGAGRGAVGDHRRRGWSDPQSCRVVRFAHRVRQRRRIPRAGNAAAGARPGDRRSRIGRDYHRSVLRDVQASLGHGPDARRLHGGRRGVVPDARLALMTGSGSRIGKA
jgi:putative chromate ion transporter